MHGIAQIHLGQIIEVIVNPNPIKPNEQVVYQVQLDQGTPIKVLPMFPRVRPSSFEGELPRKGNWGLVLFYRDEMNTGRWLGTLPNNVSNAMPLEIWQEDSYAYVNHRPNNVIDIHFQDGSIERQFPDGSLHRITHQKDGSVSNVTNNKKQTAIKVTRNNTPEGGPIAIQREDYTPNAQPPQDIYFKLPNATIEVSADGRIIVESGSHSIRLEPGREKSRDEDGNITSTPEEDAGRSVAGIYINSEKHSVVLHDDPENASDRYARIATDGGNTFTLRDKPEADKGIKATTAGGVEIEMLDNPSPKTTVKTPAGRQVVLDDATSSITVKDPATVIIDAPSIELGAGASSPVLHGAPGAEIPSTVAKTI